MLTLLSYNIFFGKKVDQVLNWLTTRKLPDIVCFQEFPMTALSELQKLLDLHNYNCNFTSATVDKNGIYGELTAYNTNKLHLLDSKSVNLGEIRLEKIVNRHLARKTALMTVFKELTLINIHLGALTTNKKRLSQLQIIMDKLPNNNKPCVVVGDYNYSNLTGLKRLLSFMAKYGFEKAVNKVRTHRLFLMPQQIDYLFYKNLEVKKLEVLNIKLSDHYPLLASLLV